VVIIYLVYLLPSRSCELRSSASQS